MTVRDLYEWAKENNALDLDVVVQYRDGGGCYEGTDDLETPIFQSREYDYQTETILVI